MYVSLMAVRSAAMVTLAVVLAVVAVAWWGSDDPTPTLAVIAPSTTSAATSAATRAIVQPPETLAPAPSLAPGEACPTTAITQLAQSPMVRVGQGRVAIVPYPLRPRTDDVTIPARPDDATGRGEIPVFWFAAPDVGSILVRGYQLDGDDVMQFNDGPNLASSVHVLFSQSWSTFGMPEGWVHDPDIWLYVNNSGCYAIDIVGGNGYHDRLFVDVLRS